MANRVDPNQTLTATVSRVSDLGLHCLPRLYSEIKELCGFSFS